MPTINLSESLVAFLKQRAERGHGGDINDFLHAHFRLSNAPKKNADRSILEYVSSPRYAARVTPAKKYLALLSFLVKLDPIRFAGLNGFSVPGTRKILVSSDAETIHRSYVTAKVEKIADSELFALRPSLRAESRDFAIHILSRLGYPVGVRQEVKRTLKELHDLSILDDL